jgi:hypothetical protein
MAVVFLDRDRFGLLGFYTGACVRSQRNTSEVAGAGDSAFSLDVLAGIRAPDRLLGNRLLLLACLAAVLSPSQLLPFWASQYLRPENLKSHRVLQRMAASGHFGISCCGSRSSLSAC